MLLNLKVVNQFKRDLKKFRHKEEVIKELSLVVETLRNSLKLPEKYLDHPLSGEYKGLRDCHIKPDVLLLYAIINETLYLERLGSHSELFK